MLLDTPHYYPNSPVLNCMVAGHTKQETVSRHEYIAPGAVIASPLDSLHPYISWSFMFLFAVRPPSP